VIRRGRQKNHNCGLNALLTHAAHD
jgi:hypothetical protein